ncbi:hypothetical protein K402DRAFT_254025 [Aulographum hederae CBS 113979]|uniref:Uncharacterized protein n=1 Tax=Aulographum hederae CBS 113979 TaxID=1176131 RepID=A0A6G1GJ12_9PEZI|nr:hypothetical protein K402DRAFT_254025 [Aulographum hederae CBS 113979]
MRMLQTANVWQNRCDSSNRQITGTNPAADCVKQPVSGKIEASHQEEGHPGPLQSRKASQLTCHYRPATPSSLVLLPSTYLLCYSDQRVKLTYLQNDIHFPLHFNTPNCKQLTSASTPQMRRPFLRHIFSSHLTSIKLFKSSINMRVLVNSTIPIISRQTNMCHFDPSNA